jgi:hypothetical protein
VDLDAARQNTPFSADKQWTCSADKQWTWMQQGKLHFKRSSKANHPISNGALDLDAARPTTPFQTKVTLTHQHVAELHVLGHLQAQLNEGSKAKYTISN